MSDCDYSGNDYGDCRVHYGAKISGFDECSAVVVPVLVQQLSGYRNELGQTRDILTDLIEELRARHSDDVGGLTCRYCTVDVHPCPDRQAIERAEHQLQKLGDNDE